MGGFIGLNPQNVNWKPKNTPRGVMSASIRPLTNKDYSNTTIYKHGSTRPNKRMYRNGYKTANNSFVNSSVISNGILQTLDAPALSTTVDSNLNNGTTLCVSDMIPNFNLTNNPEDISCSQSFCCNPQYKARRSSYPANTIKKSNYYTNTSQYLYQRNKTYSQNSFHFLKSSDDKINTLQNKPGGPISDWNNYTYHTNSHCNISGCEKDIMYNPNNYKFAKEGAVSDRTRILSLLINSRLYRNM